jgi:Rod binding domain-containing protein
MINSINSNIQNIYETRAHNSEVDLYNNIKKSASEKEQLKKVAKEFESIFITKMISTMEKSVDREGSLFSEGSYMKNFKSYMFNEIGRQVASNEHTQIGFAKKIYEQMEKYVQG